MTVADIPFASFIGVNSCEEGLSLDYNDHLQNHVKTIHASAQFTLAETKSGLYLIELFPELEGEVISLLRDATIKYKKPAVQKIFAYATISDEVIEKFNMQFQNKGRGSITVKIQIKDINNVLCSESEFNWFVQKR